MSPTGRKEPNATARGGRRVLSISAWTIVAVVWVAAIVAAAYVFLGPPPGWGTSVEDVGLSFSAESSRAALATLRVAAADTAPAYSYSALLARYDVPGQPRDFDERPESGEAVLMTSGATWTEDQRLYWRRDANDRWREIAVPTTSSSVTRGSFGRTARSRC